MSRPGGLYAFGSNGSGQLGVGHHNDVSVPTRCVLPDSLESDTPLKVAAGGNHTLVLFVSSAVCSVGENRDGRCCTLRAQQTSFSRVHFNSTHLLRIDSFKLCTATWEGSVFVTPDNSVYTCGTGSKGELGHGEDVTTVPTPQRILDFPPPGTDIVDLSSSMWHAVAVLSNGDAYGWGYGRKGQLGQPVITVWCPRKINGLGFKVIRACCGRDFTYFVGDPSTGEHAVLGSDKWQVRSSAPKRVVYWRDIAVGWGSICVLLEDHTVLSWGRNDHGQVAPADLPPIWKFAAGSEHALAVTLDQRLLAWGWGEHGNCGTETDDAGDVKLCWKEISMVQEDLTSNPSVTFVGAGCATSWTWFKS